MRISLDNKLSFNGVWADQSEDSIKTRIYYNTLNYGQLLRTREGSLNIQDLASNVNEITNVTLNGRLNESVSEYIEIMKILKDMEVEEYNNLLETIVEDSTLSISEFRRLEFITFYLNWRADELTRRKSYNCDDCRKYNFIKSRLCFLEEEVIELETLDVIQDEHDNFELIEGERKTTTVEEYLELLDKISVLHKDLSVFELGQKYFSKLFREGLSFEVCPEAIKIRSEGAAELIEMENRTEEYKVMPFPGSQIDQPALIVEAFDAIRTGRSIFHNKKMEDIRGASKSKAPIRKSGRR